MIELPPINAKSGDIVVITVNHQNWAFESPGGIIRVDRNTRSSRILNGNAVNTSNLKTWKITEW